MSQNVLGQKLKLAVFTLLKIENENIFFFIKSRYAGYGAMTQNESGQMSSEMGKWTRYSVILHIHGP